MFIVGILILCRLITILTGFGLKILNNYHAEVTMMQTKMSYQNIQIIK